MKEKWNSSNFGQRVAILRSYGCGGPGATYWASQSWDALPPDLQEGLADDYEQHGDLS